MSDLKEEKAAVDVFVEQVKYEAQVHSRPPRPIRQRLIRIFLTVAILYHLYFWYWDWPYSLELLKSLGGHHEHSHHIFGRTAEKAFLSIPDGQNAIQNSRRFAGQPHLAGSITDLDTAERFLSTLQGSFGITMPKQKPIFEAGSHDSRNATLGIIERNEPSAWIDKYYPVMNTPLERALEILDDFGNILWSADLVEHAPEGDDRDRDAARFANAVPTFHGLSVNGDVTGHLINGNYCTKEDYDGLAAEGAPLEGSIVLCRYGMIFRGLKIKGGQEHGAVGVVIYTDPRDDGAVTVENGFAPYPDGPARNPTSVQRGSVQFISVYPGDPTTPGYPAYENSTRQEATNTPSIPSLPLSWENAQTLLQVLTPGSPLEGKPVRLFNSVDSKVTPIWNVIGVIPGYIKNEVVVAGNHRDAWVLGSADPTSGTVSVNEIIRGFGHLLKKGWKPLRTIVIASWDAEEYGLIGSVEWGEDFEDWINRHVVAYLNLDVAVSGSQFGTSGSPLLAHFIRETAREIPHPTDENRTLWDARQDEGVFSNTGKTKEEGHILSKKGLVMTSTDTGNLGVSPLGSGSDYTVFLQRIGIPASDEGFGNTGHDPVYHYHSVFDSNPWMERFGDPGFNRHIAISKHLGLEIMRMSSLPILPFNTTHYSLQLESYFDTVKNLPETKELGIDLSSLRSSISKVHKASLRFDKEKRDAWHELVDVLRRWWKHHKHHHKHKHGKDMLIQDYEDIPVSIEEALAQWYEIEQGEMDYELVDSCDIHGSNKDKDKHKHKHKHKKWRKLIIHAIRRIQNVNEKLRTFERGFISKEGIKDREWFRHLGVAPGKWLGYGATTFPGLTEAIVFDFSKENAEKERDRLVDVLGNIAKNLKV